MSARRFVGFLAATAIVVVVYLVYGLSALLAPIMFVLWFFLFLGIFTFRTLMEANSTPGLEKLEEPNFLFSPVYFGWLYVNDRKRWSKYVTAFASIMGLLFGFMSGFVAAILLKLDYPSPVSCLWEFSRCP